MAQGGDRVVLSEASPRRPAGVRAEGGRPGSEKGTRWPYGGVLFGAEVQCSAASTTSTATTTRPSRSTAKRGESVGYYQHLNDDWDLDHPFERILVDTAVASDPTAVSWINPRFTPAETRRVLTGIPRHTQQDRRRLHARPGHRRVPVRAADSDAERDQLHRRPRCRATSSRTPRWCSAPSAKTCWPCPSWIGGKDWESVCRSSESPMNPVFIGDITI